MVGVTAGQRYTELTGMAMRRVFMPTVSWVEQESGQPKDRSDLSDPCKSWWITHKGEQVYLIEPLVENREFMDYG